MAKMALLSHSLPKRDGGGIAAKLSEPLMIDQPEKTQKLLAALTAALPFEVELTPPLIAQLGARQIDAALASRQMAAKISYAGDEGGILCHLAPAEGRSTIIVSLTHVRIRRPLQLAKAVFEYQKHRVKKLKKQNSK